MSADSLRPPLGQRAKDKMLRIGNRGVGWVRRRLSPPSFPVSADGQLRLHLGCGMIDAPGYVNVDLLDAPHVHIQRPLDDLSIFADGSVDLVYACHCLEHFGYRHSRMVVEEWARVLRPGGVLRISVPDFAVLSRAYQEGVPLQEIQGLVLGGQDYRLNFHAALFDEAALRDLMSALGLVEIAGWDPATVDHHGFVDESGHMLDVAGKTVPLSLNLQGRKA